MSRVRTARPKRSHGSADMVGMAVSQNDEINILSRSSGRRQRIDQGGARSSEVSTRARVDEDEPTFCTNNEDIAGARKLTVLVEHTSELAFGLRQIRIRRNVETRRHRKGARATELPGHGASRTRHTASLGNPRYRRSPGAQVQFRTQLAWPSGSKLGSSRASALADLPRSTESRLLVHGTGGALHMSGNRYYRHRAPVQMTPQQL